MLVAAICLTGINSKHFIFPVYFFDTDLRKTALVIESW